MKIGEIKLCAINKVFSSCLVSGNDTYYLKGIAFDNFRDTLVLKNILKTCDQVVVQCHKTARYPIVELWRPWPDFVNMTYDQKIMHMSQTQSINVEVLRLVGKPPIKHFVQTVDATTSVSAKH